MKTQDLISVVSIAVVGTLIAYFVMNAILGDPLDKTVSFDYLDFDAGQFYEPDGEMFNSAAINPTVDVYVGTCVDINHNGLLEDFEKVECGQAVETKQDDVTTSDDEEEESGNTYDERENSRNNNSSNNGTNNSSNNTRSSTESEGTENGNSSSSNNNQNQNTNTNTNDTSNS